MGTELILELMMCVFLHGFYRYRLFHPLASLTFLFLDNVAIVIFLLLDILIMVTVVHKWPEHFGIKHSQLKQLQ